MTTIGRYHVVKEVGRGGMATVYRARTAEGSVVAIKLMAGELLGDPHLRRRFRREAEVLSRLRHPAIVPILDYGEHLGQPYLVMPYLEGGTLGDRVASGAMPPRKTALLTRIASALDSAHAQHVVHRDVKPSNILFDATEQPYLTDFGIVKLLGEAQSAITHTGASLGTPGYMSPEQVRGETLDGRCDIYALGVVLFEMLTGRLPFTATNPYTQAFQHISVPIPQLRQVNPALSPDWQPILERAMAKRRDDRYPTAAAMAADLVKVAGQAGQEWAGGAVQVAAQPQSPMRPSAARFITDTPSARPPTKVFTTNTALSYPALPLPEAPTPPVPSPSASRSRGVWLAGLALVIVLLGGLAWGLWSFLGRPAAATPTPTITVASPAATTTLPIVAPIATSSSTAVATRTQAAITTATLAATITATRSTAFPTTPPTQPNPTAAPAIVPTTAPPTTGPLPPPIEPPTPTFPPLPTPTREPPTETPPLPTNTLEPLPTNTLEPPPTITPPPP